MANIRSGLGGAMSGAAAGAPLGTPGIIGGAILGGLGGLFGGDEQDTPDYSALLAQQNQQANEAYGRGYGYADRGIAAAQRGQQFAQGVYEGAQPGIARLRELAGTSARDILGSAGTLRGYGSEAQKAFRDSLGAYGRAAQGLRGYEADPYVRSEMERMGAAGTAAGLSAGSRAITDARRMGMDPDQMRRLMASTAQRNVATTAGLMDTGRRGAMERERSYDLDYAQRGLPYGQMAGSYEQAAAGLAPTAYNVMQAGQTADLPYASMAYGGYKDLSGAYTPAMNLAANQGGAYLGSASRMGQLGQSQGDDFWSGMGALGGSLSNIAGQKGGLDKMAGWFGGGAEAPTPTGAMSIPAGGARGALYSAATQRGY